MSEALRTIAVAGGGPVALVAATAFARALPRSRVVLVPAPVPSDALADRWPATLPSSAALFEPLGIDRGAWLASGMARERLASRFEAWNADGTPWLVGDGDFVPGPSGVVLHQLWLRAGGAAALPLHALSPAVVLAEAGRAAPPVDEPASPFTRVEPALVLDTARAAPLAQAARAAGVVAAPMLAGVEAAGSRLSAVRLADGGRLAADLFVDATGPAAPLAAALADGFDDWRSALPCDRLLVAPDPASANGAIDAYRAVELGWTAQWSGVRAFGHAAADERQAARTFDAAERVAVRPGRRAAAWVGNCLAIGDAAVQSGPLGRTGFSLALAQVGLALELLPSRDMEPLLIAEYNRRAALRADRLRDWLAAHYLAGGRRLGAFWRRIGSQDAPPGLTRTLAQVARRGHVPHAEEESVGRDAWLSVLLGQSLRPELADPVALGIAPEAARAAVRALAADLAARVAALPPR